MNFSWAAYTAHNSRPAGRHLPILNCWRGSYSKSYSTTVRSPCQKGPETPARRS